MQMIASIFHSLPWLYWLVLGAAVFLFLMELAMCRSAHEADEWIAKHPPTDPVNNFPEHHDPLNTVGEQRPGNGAQPPPGYATAPSFPTARDGGNVFIAPRSYQQAKAEDALKAQLWKNVLTALNPRRGCQGNVCQGNGKKFYSGDNHSTDSTANL